jgi:hypothetical protein
MSVNKIEVKVNNEKKNIENITFDNKNEFKNYYNSKKENYFLSVSINNEEKSEKELLEFLNMKEKLFIIEDLGFDDNCPVYTCGAEHKRSITNREECWKYTEEEANFLIEKDSKHSSLKKEHINKNILEFIVDKTKETINKQKIKTNKNKIK